MNKPTAKSLMTTGNDYFPAVHTFSIKVYHSIIYIESSGKKLNVKSIALLGNNGGKAKKLSDLHITVPSKTTARIQEIHIFLAHYIALQVEKKLVKKKNND